MVGHVCQEYLECDKLHDRNNYVYSSFQLKILSYFLFEVVIVFLGSGSPMFDKLDHDPQLLTVSVNGSHSIFNFIY